LLFAEVVVYFFLRFRFVFRQAPWGGRTRKPGPDAARTVVPTPATVALHDVTEVWEKAT
jgi:hypothetical protein